MFFLKTSDRLTETNTCYCCNECIKFDKLNLKLNSNRRSVKTTSGSILVFLFLNKHV